MGYIYPLIPPKGYTAAQGLRLKKIYHGVYANTESANTMYEHNNTGGVVVTSYHTMLDNVRRQQFNVNCTIGEDYILNRDKIKGSTLITSDTYYYNWCLIEDFTDMKSRSEIPTTYDEDNLIVGVNLAGAIERKVDIYLTTAGGQYNNYSFSVTERMLSVSPGGIAFF